MKIEGHTVVITGGASGLGEGCVRNFTGKGANAVILDLDETRGNQIASDLGAAALFCKTDVTDPKSVQQAIDMAMDRFGVIHIAVNCAGVATPSKVLGKHGPMAIKTFDQVIRINLIGTMNIIRLAAEKMTRNEPNLDGEKGVIINTASIAAFDGQIGQAAYAASKAGIVGMTLPIAREFTNHGIRVMTIAPGLFETPMLAGLPEKAQQSLIASIPFPKRLGKPSEFAQLATQIIENPILNGETIRLDSAIRMGA
ncbi:3-hydroxy-2-methylbutyryl-CoA dehydrogenase [Desulfosarcina widdelii]|uniref:3-hydroxy-2-methylbutyryl-CoA dehydrogenase n=1 Tax=Desulfosarcina widdelii TaxID=947919 RepID=A0A5K7YZ05_9BACT|nr:SDR family NAD(P)-dependent oxidoreductase [Desulfosarcina widdelii]BBO74626.1 3-hydroxy-2-methylbutyryl-CoA dehydrogenase [Desulfosarcina widdelii]